MIRGCAIRVVLVVAIADHNLEVVILKVGTFYIGDNNIKVSLVDPFIHTLNHWWRAI